MQICKATCPGCSISRVVLLGIRDSGCRDRDHFFYHPLVCTSALSVCEGPLCPCQYTTLTVVRTALRITSMMMYLVLAFEFRCTFLSPTFLIIPFSFSIQNDSTMSFSSATPSIASNGMRILAPRGYGLKQEPHAGTRSASFPAKPPLVVQPRSASGEYHRSSNPAIRFGETADDFSIGSIEESRPTRRVTVDGRPPPRLASPSPFYVSANQGGILSRREGSHSPTSRPAPPPRASFSRSSSESEKISFVSPYPSRMRLPTAPSPSSSPPVPTRTLNRSTSLGEKNPVPRSTPYFRNRNVSNNVRPASPTTRVDPPSPQSFPDAPALAPSFPPTRPGRTISSPTGHPGQQTSLPKPPALSSSVSSSSLSSFPSSIPQRPSLSRTLSSPSRSSPPRLAYSPTNLVKAPLPSPFSHLPPSTAPTPSSSSAEEVRRAHLQRALDIGEAFKSTLMTLNSVPGVEPSPSSSSIKGRIQTEAPVQRLSGYLISLVSFLSLALRPPHAFIRPPLHFAMFLLLPIIRIYLLSLLQVFHFFDSLCLIRHDEECKNSSICCHQTARGPPLPHLLLSSPLPLLLPNLLHLLVRLFLFFASNPYFVSSSPFPFIPLFSLLFSLHPLIKCQGVWPLLIDIWHRQWR